MAPRLERRLIEHSCAIILILVEKRLIFTSKGTVAWHHRYFMTIDDLSFGKLCNGIWTFPPPLQESICLWVVLMQHFLKEGMAEQCTAVRAYLHCSMRRSLQLLCRRVKVLSQHPFQCQPASTRVRCAIAAIAAHTVCMWYATRCINNARCVLRNS